MQAARRQAAAMHGVLFLILLAVFMVGLPLPWPLYLLLPLLIYAGVVLVVPLLRRTAPRLTLGRMAGGPLAATVALSVATTIALIGFQKLARADMADLAARLPNAAVEYLVLAAVCFSITNALLEELIFRGILWELVASERGNVTALIVTSALFGAFHFHGYPPGLIGAILAGLYGLALGLLRWWTGGLGLVVVCHMCADATIFGLLIYS